MFDGVEAWASAVPLVPQADRSFFLQLPAASLLAWHDRGDDVVPEHLELVAFSLSTKDASIRANDVRGLLARVRWCHSCNWEGRHLVSFRFPCPQHREVANELGIH